MLEVINGRSIYAGQIYRHFKNKLYQIVTVANHSETGEKLVIYQQLYGGYEVYARPLEMFMSEVDRDKYPMAEQKYRFELVEREELVNAGNGMNVQKDKFAEKLSITNQNDYFFEEKVADRMKNVEDAQDGNTSDVMNDKSDYKKEISNSNMQENETINPYLLKFLDADTYEEKRNILIRMKGEMTNRLIDDIAASLDVAVENGNIEERYISLLNCIDMMVKYEVNRFR